MTHGGASKSEGGRRRAPFVIKDSETAVEDKEPKLGAGVI